MGTSSKLESGRKEEPHTGAQDNNTGNSFALGLILLAALLLAFLAVSYGLFLMTKDRDLANNLNESVLFAFRYGFLGFLLLMSTALGGNLKKVLVRFFQGS